MGRRQDARLRIGQLSVYFGLFDAAMPGEFRADRTRYALEVGALLSRHGDVTYPELVDSDDAGRRAGGAFAAHAVDVVVYAPTMAAPPSYAWEAVRDLDGVPIVTLAAQEITSVPADYDTEEATRRSLPVGLAMFTNVLVREARPFLAVAGVLGSDELEAKLERALAAARAARLVRGGRLAMIGGPLPGYLDIEADPAALAALGPQVVDVPRAELNDSFARVEQAAVDDAAEQTRARFPAGAVPAAVLERSVRLALAVEQLCDRHEIDAGAVNCHSDVLRWNPEIGITACLAVARLSQAGRPFSCTGDLPTALALAIGKVLAGAALYCELYAMDVAQDWVLAANGGEGDTDIRAPGTPVRLLPEEHYMGDRGPGTAVAFDVRSGPATLAGLSPARGVQGGWVLVAAQGTVIGAGFEALEGPNARFRFAGGPVTESFERWCEAGATHHAALLPGEHAASLRIVARLLGIEVREV
jgi:L-arabinose isomerase